MSFEPGKNSKVTQAITPTAGAAGTSDINGATLDMSGAESVMAIITFGAITATAVTSVKWQSGAAANMSDAADLAGTAITVADSDDDNYVVAVLIKPLERYVRIVVDRGTANAVVAAANYIQFGTKKAPVSHDSNNIATETHVSPAEGTA